MSALDTAAQVRAGQRCALDMVEESLAAIESRNADLNAVLLVTADAARAAAASIDRRVAAGEPVGPLAGVPLGVKGNMCTRGLPAT